jgi:hypothetical protein
LRACAKLPFLVDNPEKYEFFVFSVCKIKQ